MKKLLFTLVTFVLLSGCSQILVEDFSNTSESESFSIVTPNESKTISVSSDSKIYVVDASTSSVTLTGDISGKTIHYALVNTSSADVSKDFMRYISTGNGRSALSELTDVENFPKEYNDESDHACYHGYDFSPVFEKNSSKAIADERHFAKEKLSYEVGKTSKNIYAAVDENTYKLKKATLWAYNDICNIWILDDDKYITGANKKTLASRYAEKFSAMYPVIQNVFGKESDSIYTSTCGTTISMNNTSDTGTKVNIVIYDLFGDKSCGRIIGFFSGMDYYKNSLAFSNITIDHSNEGKYFYIDSVFARNSFDVTVSTLAHEFQHMINFGVKSMNKIPCDQNFNEMLSMLCEDMMQQFLGLNDSASPKNRMSCFSSNYYRTGIREYDDTAVSYANAYAFGAWLTRKYGGASLVKEMMQNGKSNNACITAAVNSVNGTSLSFKEIFAQFVSSCFSEKASPTGKDAPRNLVDEKSGYNYPMTAYSSAAPKIYQNTSISEISGSYGMFLKTWRTIGNNETCVTLNFDSKSGNTYSGLLVYLYIE